MNTHATGTGTGTGTGSVVEWGRARAGDLLGLIDAAYPGDRLTLDELESAWWGLGDEPSTDRTVLGRADGSAALALRRVATRAVVEVVVGSRSDRLDDLIDAASATARTWGSSALVVGGSMPDHLWPGLQDGNDTSAGVLEAAGFVPIADASIRAVPTTFRAEPVPATVAIEQVLDGHLADATVRDLDAWSSLIEPWLGRAIDQATCIVALDETTGHVLGVIVHSVGRDGWIGPVVVAASARRCGIGSALVAHAARDLMVAGFSEAPLSWRAPETVDERDIVERTGPTSGSKAPANWPAPFLDHLGARPWRTFRRWALELS